VNGIENRGQILYSLTAANIIERMHEIGERILSLHHKTKTMIYFCRGRLFGRLINYHRDRVSIIDREFVTSAKKNSRISTNFQKIKKFVKIRTKIR